MSSVENGAGSQSGARLGCQGHFLKSTHMSIFSHSRVDTFPLHITRASAVQRKGNIYGVSVQHHTLATCERNYTSN